MRICLLFCLSYLVLFCPFFADKTYADTHVVLIGGGGESGDGETVFDPFIAAFPRQNPALKFDDVSFGSGQTLLNAKLSDKFSEHSSFSKENYAASMQKFLSQVQSLHDQDQVIVMIASHGTQQFGNEKGHSVSASDGVINPAPELQRLKDAIRASHKNIKLAVIDLSCFSGAIMDLADHTTCVISSTSTFSSGSGDFAQNLVHELYSSPDLFEAFLRARKNTKSYDFPLISSANDLGMADFQKKFAPLAVADIETNYGGREFWDKNLSSYLSQPGDCVLPLSAYNPIFTQLSSTMNQILLQNFEGSINDYISVQAKLQKSLLMKSRQEAYRLPDGDDRSISWGMLAKLDNSGVERSLQATKDASSRQILAELKQQDNLRAELYASNPDFKSLVDNSGLAEQALSAQSMDLALKVIEQERPAYDTLIRQSVEKSDKNDACMQFKLAK